MKPFTFKQLILFVIFINAIVSMKCQTNQEFIVTNAQRFQSEIQEYNDETPEDLEAENITNFMDYFWKKLTGQVIGKGGFGEVKELNWKLDGKNTAIALKKIEIPEDVTDDLITMQIEPVQREIDMLDFLNQKDKFSFPILYNCVIDLKDELGPADLYIFQEKLYSDLSKDKFKDEFISKRSTPLERIRIYGILFASLAVMHENNLIHSDIKPGNIMASDTEFSILKLIDFGAANTEGEYITAGSPAYNSPERINFNTRTLSKAQDIWALALTIANIESRGNSIFSDIDQKCFTKKFDELCYKGLLTNFGIVVNKVFEKKEIKKLLKKMLQFEPENRPNARMISEEFGKILEAEKDNIFLSSPSNHVFQFTYKEGGNNKKIIKALEKSFSMDELEMIKTTEVIINEQGKIPIPKLKRNRIYFIKKPEKGKFVFKQKPNLIENLPLTKDLEIKEPTRKSFTFNDFRTKRFKVMSEKEPINLNITKSSFDKEVKDEIEKKQKLPQVHNPINKIKLQNQLLISQQDLQNRDYLSHIKNVINYQKREFDQQNQRVNNDPVSSILRNDKIQFDKLLLPQTKVVDIIRKVSNNPVENMQSKGLIINRVRPLKKTNPISIIQTPSDYNRII